MRRMVMTAGMVCGHCCASVHGVGAARRAHDDARDVVLAAAIGNT